MPFKFLRKMFKNLIAESQENTEQETAMDTNKHNKSINESQTKSGHGHVQQTIKDNKQTTKQRTK